MKNRLISFFGLTFMSSVAMSASMFNVVQNTSGEALTINTTIPNHTYPAAGIKINTPGYSLVPNSQCTYAGNGYCLFSVSNTVPKTIEFTGSGSASLSFNLCLNGKGPNSCQQVNVSPISHFLYVTNNSNSTVSLCTFTEDGLLSSCIDAGASGDLSSSNPQGIAINASKTMAYITQGFSSLTVYQCLLNADGTFNFCTRKDITNPAGGASTYGMIALNPSNKFAYILDSMSGKILACPISAGNLSTSCTDTGAAGFSSSVSGIELNKAGSKAYLTDYSNQTVTVCDVNNASFDSCIAKTGGSSLFFNEPGDTAFNKNETIVYVTDYGNNAVYGCSTSPNNTNQFDSCFVATSGLTHPWGIAVNTTGTVAYVTNYDNTTYQCPILDDGTFSACSANTSFNGSVGVAVS